MAGEKYQHFDDLYMDYIARGPELQAKLNANMAQQEEARADRVNYMLAGDENKATEASKRLKDLKEQCDVLNDAIIAHSNPKNIRMFPDIMRAGKDTITANAEQMAQLRARFDNIATGIMEHKAAFLAGICELGKIERAAVKLHRQNNDVAVKTGLTAGWQATPASDHRVINFVKNTGLIFVEVKESIDRFKFPENTRK